MNVEQAQQFLLDLADSIEKKYDSSAQVLALQLRETAQILQSLQENCESAWQMLDDLKQSEISNHQHVLLHEINGVLKEKKKIMKVGEA